MTELDQCQINLRITDKVGLPDYSSLEVGASVTVVVPANAIDEGFQRCYDQVQKGLSESREQALLERARATEARS
jgi:hypothetical protein